MKFPYLAALLLCMTLMQTACSDSSEALASYANANNCTVLGVSPTTTASSGAAAAASAQVPCSLQSVSKAVSDSGVSVTQVSTGGTATASSADLDKAVQAQAQKVQGELAKLGVSSQAAESSSARGPASISSTDPEPAASAGEGEAVR